MTRKCRAPKATSARRCSYHVIKPSEFHDHRPAYSDPLSFTRPKELDLKEIKRLAISSLKLLDGWKLRYKTGVEHPLKNGFKIMPEHRQEHQAVFRLSAVEQKRLVWNRSVCFWNCLNKSNSYDTKNVLSTLNRITDPDLFPDSVFPSSKYGIEVFCDAVEKNINWKRAFLTLHQMIRWLKSLIYLHMFSPQFDFRFCELRYEFEPINSWNPLPVDSHVQSSLYQTNIRFQKLSDFILISDQIQALTKVLSYEAAVWCKNMEALKRPQNGSNQSSLPVSILHQVANEIHMEKMQIRLLSFDTHIDANRKSLSALRLLTITENRAVIIAVLLKPESQEIKKLICRSEIPKDYVHNYVHTDIKLDESCSKLIICDKYIVIYENLDVDHYKLASDGRRIPRCERGPSLTIWDREGNLKERKKLHFKPGLSCYLKRLPGRRFALIQKTAYGEAKSLIFNLEHPDPILYNGEVEDSNANYFTLRLADHVQFYVFNNKIDKEAEYLFSIRSLLDERIRLCSGGNDRYATSRISLPYHIQVYNFLPRISPKLNSKNTSLKQVAVKLGQYEELYNCMETISYPKPIMVFTRPFKQSISKNSLTNDDARLRILASVAGSWHISENNCNLIPNPGEHFALCPNGILIHDVQHDLLCFQPLKNGKSNEGRLLLSLPHQTNTEINENEFFLPIGKCWGRIYGNNMYFYSQSIVTGSLLQHRVSFGLPNQKGFLTTKNDTTRHRRNPVRQVSFKCQISQEFALMPVNDTKPALEDSEVD